ncbi:cytochrome P450 [Pseudonocardia spinosispora]|uniref:cytochrome P450 n=1 Tax=Pseudonocardia spinosispora TaxID=103441 RepID=UPI0003F6B6C8|nr:cytochrome P450 [Pseudonocardia spinosispora]
MTSALINSMRSTVVALVGKVQRSPRPLAESPDPALRPVLGEPGAPLVGHALSTVYDSLAFSRRRSAEFGPVYWSRVFGTDMITVVSPEGVEQVATNADKAFSSEGAYEYLIGPFFHRGLLLMDFEQHLQHRRIMQQAFVRPRLIGYLNVMNPKIATVLDEWRPGARFELYSAAKQLTLDIANEVFVGESVGADADRITKAFIDAVRGGQTAIRSDVPGGNWHRGLRGRRVLEKYFRDRLDAHRAGEGDDLFTVLCQSRSDEGETFSDDDVVNHMIFLMMAAHDTSTITLAMMGYYLGRYPEWQEKARAESRALGRDAIEFTDLDQLTTLDQVMKEAMRLNAPVGGLFRKALRDTSILGHHIPAGAMIVASSYASQRQGEVWANPDEFDPGRFAEDRREDKVHRYAWAPFGGGVHKCIGMHFGTMEIKAIMHQLLLGHRWTVPADYEPPIGYGTGPMPLDGLPITLEPLPNQEHATT